MSTVGEQLVQVLQQAGVSRVYGVVGDSLNPFVDAIRRTEGIEAPAHNIAACNSEHLPHSKDQEVAGS